MAKPRILIVGKDFSGQKTYLENHGFDYVVLKDKALTNFPDKNFRRRVVCDFDDPAAVFAAVDELAAKHKIDGVLTIYEQFVAIAADIAARLGLPALPKSAAGACTDKFIMRQKFAKSPEKISPDFAIVESEHDLRAFAGAHDFPLILKPANLSKSLLVSKNDSLEELLHNYERTLHSIKKVYAKYAPHATPKLLVEEFMAGPVHSVDAFVDASGEPFVLDAVVDYQTGHDIGYDDNFHYSRLLPSKLSAREIAEVRHVATLGIKALGMKNSPAHVEIILTNEGPRIVEIGARNGGYRERMHTLANGIDIVGNALRLALGQKPDVKATRHESVGVFELFPKTPGIFAGITNEAALRALPSFLYLSVKSKIGAFVGKSSDGYKMCAVVMLHNADAEQFARDTAFLRDEVLVKTTHADV